MKLLQPVVWSKGTFLTPQHLQAQDRFIEDSLRFQIEALSFRPWGFDALEIDQQGLTAGVVGISRARGIFPDGLAFDIPDSDGAPSPTTISNSFGVDEDALDLFLAIPHYRDKGVNVSHPSSNTDARFQMQTALLRDENTGLSEKAVQVGSKSFRILTRAQVNEGTAAMQIARVRRTRDELFELDPYFIPPLLNFAANEYLTSILRRLLEILSAKSSELAANRRQKNPSLATFTSSDIPNFWLLYTVNSFFPPLFHYFSRKHAHPETVFGLMLSLAGALTTFSTTIQPSDFPRYDHENLTFCFSDLDAKVRQLLDTVVRSNFVALPLKLTQPPSIYAAALDQDRYFKGTSFYLAVSADLSAAEIIERIPLLVKAASASQVEVLLRQQLKGLTLTYSHQPPATIPVKVNYHYFRIEQSGSAWESIPRSRNFGAYVPGDFPNVQLELVIVLP